MNLSKSIITSYIQLTGIDIYFSEKKVNSPSFFFLPDFYPVIKNINHTR